MMAKMMVVMAKMIPPHCHQPHHRPHPCSGQIPVKFLSTSCQLLVNYQLTSRPLSVHFRSTFDPLPDHFRSTSGLLPVQRSKHSKVTWPGPGTNHVTVISGSSKKWSHSSNSIQLASNSV